MARSLVIVVCWDSLLGVNKNNPGRRSFGVHFSVRKWPPPRFKSCREERRFEELPQRAEEHLLVSRKSGKRKKHDGLVDAASRANRARRTAVVGAKRMATTGLASSMHSFDKSEDLFWAKELRTSSLAKQAYCDPRLEPPPSPPEEDWDMLFAGLHYAALTAPGPTGSRRASCKQLVNQHEDKPHHGAAHVPAGHQPRVFLPLAGHHRTDGGKRYLGAPCGG